MRTFRCGFVVIVLLSVLAVAISVFATPQFSSSQSIVFDVGSTGSGCYLCIYNYTTGDPPTWTSWFSSSGATSYTLPGVDETLGFWTYDVDMASYVDVLWAEHLDL